MQEMLADEAPAVWLYMHPRLVVTKKGVTGIWKDLPRRCWTSPRWPGRSSLAPPGEQGRCAAVHRPRASRALAATLFFVSLLVFVVVRVLPGDPALIILGLEANPDSVARVRQALGSRPAHRRSSTCSGSAAPSAAISGARSSTTCRWRALSSPASP